MTWVALSILVFFAAAIYDWCAAHYVAANTRGDASSAAAWSAATGIAGLFGLASILQISYWLSIPEIAGIYAGTYLAVSRR